MKTSSPHHVALGHATRHWREAFGLAVVVVRDHGKAEDICQEALVRIGSAAGPIDRPDRVRNLFLQIVRNLAISEMRRPRLHSLDAAVEATGPLTDPDSEEPAELLARKEEVTTVREALARLDPVWGSILFLRDGVGLSYAEIAEVVDKTVDVVRVTLHRARARIRELLQGPIDERSPA